MSEPTHTMPDSDKEVQSQVEAVFGFRPCLWQIRVVHAILNGNNVINIAPTGSGKSMTYWMPLLYIKHGISVVVTPLKLLGGQFADMLQDNRINCSDQRSSVSCVRLRRPLQWCKRLGWRAQRIYSKRSKIELLLSLRMLRILCCQELIVF